MTMSHEEALIHSGVLRKSGRYPWGSGTNPNQRNNKAFIDYVEDLRKSGMTPTQIAEGLGMTTTQLRAVNSIAKNQLKAADISQATRLADTGMSNIAIGLEMGRNLLAPGTKERNDSLLTTANMLKDEVASKKYLDVGVGTENHMGVSGTKLSTAVAMLKDEGYQLHKINVQQQGTGEFTKMKVLVGPDTTFKELVNNQDKIGTIAKYSENDGASFFGLKPVNNVDSKRLMIRYDEDGGTNMDGVIEVRRGAPDLDMGQSRYAQVRIGVDGSHYLKGMAVYADDLPDGIDIRFNTNKSNTVAKLDTLKPMKTLKDGSIDPDNPFGSQIKPGGQKGALNIVYEEGDWHGWSNKLSSQMISKQSPALAKQQLGLGYDIRKNEYDKIMALTNPAIKKKLLNSFADGADSSSIHLKAAGLPRTKTHVILPVTDMLDTEIYAPNYRDGERVVLIRHPHGGKFEIPELTVNNRHKNARNALGNAMDAVGISPKVAEQLSGADFDGDTVLVIPNNSRSISTSPPLKGLQNFNPKADYKQFEGMKLMDSRGTQHQMGNISNLITDMTIRGANTGEIVRAVRHSMVVIDSEKHKLNYKQSAIDHNIAALKVKYQGSARGGASTIVSRASSQTTVLKRKPRSSRDGGAIDINTGEKRFTETGESYVRKGKTTVNSKGVERTAPDKVVFNKTDSVKIAETSDAHTLSSGQPMERVYADHANRLKAMGNTARKSALQTKDTPYSPSAKKTYITEFDSLKAKLNLALMNKPIERQAQLLAGATIAAKRQASPDMDADELKKVKSMALQGARLRTGALKQRIDISPIEWEAIQAGAISTNFLNSILENTDLDRVKELATPRTATGMSTAEVARAKGMIGNGYTQAEVADALGVPTSTLNDSLA